MQRRARDIDADVQDRTFEPNRDGRASGGLAVSRLYNGASTSLLSSWS
jgi:hypothetical protein